MNSDDLIKRGDARNMKFSSYKIGAEGVFVNVLDVIANIEAIPAVPREMTAREYETALDRMEDSVDGFEIKKLWNEATGLVSTYEHDERRRINEEAEKRRKTYAEDFKERCPNHLHNCGMPIVCRNEVYGFGGRCTVEEAVKRGGCSSCWNAEMEGEK